MTDRVHSLTVVLDGDVREDDVEHLVAAIRQFRRVLAVTPNVADQASWMAEVRARRELREAVRTALAPLMDEMVGRGVATPNHLTGR